MMNSCTGVRCSPPCTYIRTSVCAHVARAMQTHTLDWYGHSEERAIRWRHVRLKLMSILNDTMLCQPPVASSSLYVSCIVGPIGTHDLLFEEQVTLGDVIPTLWEANAAQHRHGVGDKGATLRCCSYVAPSWLGIYHIPGLAKPS